MAGKTDNWNGLLEEEDSPQSTEGNLEDEKYLSESFGTFVDRVDSYSNSDCLKELGNLQAQPKVYEVLKGEKEDELISNKVKYLFLKLVDNYLNSGTDSPLTDGNGGILQTLTEDVYDTMSRSGIFSHRLEGIIHENFGYLLQNAELKRKEKNFKVKLADTEKKGKQFGCAFTGSAILFPALIGGLSSYLSHRGNPELADAVKNGMLITYTIGMGELAYETFKKIRERFSLKEEIGKIKESEEDIKNAIKVENAGKEMNILREKYGLPPKKLQ